MILAIWLGVLRNQALPKKSLETLKYDNTPTQAGMGLSFFGLKDYSQRQGYLSLEQERATQAHFTEHSARNADEVCAYILAEHGQSYSSAGAAKLMRRLYNFYEMQIVAILSQKGIENYMQVSVRDNNVDQALRVLKKKLQSEGVFREMKLKQHFEKPSEKKARNKAEAISRARKLARKKLEREG